MGEQMQSLRSPCVLFSIFKRTEKDDREGLKVYAISIFLHALENKIENMVSITHCSSIY